MISDIPGKMVALRTRALLPDLEGMELEEVLTPRPGRGDVLVRVRAASIGFPDLLMSHGGYQTRLDLPFTGGMDAAGEIAVVGDDVDEFEVGDPVAAMYIEGGFAQYAVYPATAVWPKSTSLSFARAAALGSAYLTAYVALVRCASVSPGEWLLVHGAAGGVGLATVDLARALGVRVIAAASSPEKLHTISIEYAPEALIDSRAGFREQVKAITVSGADIIFDPIGGETFTESTRCIAFGGRLLVVGFASGNIATVATNIPLLKGFSVVGVRAGEYGKRFPERGRENQTIVRSLAAEGRIRPHVHAELPLCRWREGFRMLMERTVIGRVVLVPEH
jgi:NADPH2:quinone reductase